MVGSPPAKRQRTDVPHSTRPKLWNMEQGFLPLIGWSCSILPSKILTYETHTYMTSPVRDQENLDRLSFILLYIKFFNIAANVSENFSSETPTNEQGNNSPAKFLQIETEISSVLNNDNTLSHLADSIHENNLKLLGHELDAQKTEKASLPQFETSGEICFKSLIQAREIYTELTPLINLIVMVISLNSLMQ